MFECRNCAAHRSQPFYDQVRDRLHGHAGVFNYVRCADCGLVQIEEIPADLGSYYDNYRVHGRESSVYRLLRRVMIGHCYLETPGHGRAMLDFGAGSGWYLKAMADAGWNATGYELDPAHAAALSQQLALPVISGEAALAAHPAAFDLITLNFAFEHLDRPRHVLALLRRCLKPGGQIYLSVPNIESREAKLFKDRWFHLDPPRHVSFFTKPLLSQVLRDAGFADISIKDLAVPTGFAGSLSYRLWNRFESLTWYGAVVPGLVFSSIVRDGNFAITARLAAS
jgi:SAM-dependent methyltransferase